MDLIHYKVSGTVQGVMFRAHTQKEAHRLGIRGWCHNHPDSSVEGMAAGPTEKIHEFRKYLEKGPPHADVRGVQLFEEKSGVSEEEVRQYLGHNGEEYEIRSYKK